MNTQEKDLHYSNRTFRKARNIRWSGLQDYSRIKCRIEKARLHHGGRQMFTPLY